MATLAESFLADLEDLSDASDQPDQPEEQDDVDDDINMLGDGLDGLDHDNLDSVAGLTQTERYQRIMAGVRETLQHAASLPEGAEEPSIQGPTEEDPTYKLLVECNALVVDIENEIAIIHNFIRDRYRLKFPELESLVHSPVDYARVVKIIGNEMDITDLDLESILPPAAVMVITVTATTTSGKPLLEDDLAKVLLGCDRMLQVVSDCDAILDLVQRKMHRIAPNLSAAVGTEIAAQLMGAAGGLLNLSKMPAGNVQLLGAKRRNLAGFSSTAAQRHQGYLFTCDIVQNTPPSLRIKAGRLVGTKCTLLARVDAYGQDPTGRIGADFKADMLRRVEKWQEPPPAKIIKPLPPPDQAAKKRRGGRKARKMKERLGLTDVKRAANRVNFNQPEEEIIDGDDIIGLGLLGSKEGSGRLRVQAQQQKQKLSAKTMKKHKNRMSGLQTSGLASTLALSTVGGIDLVDPTAGPSGAPEDNFKSGTESYFSEYQGFRSLAKKAP